MIDPCERVAAIETAIKGRKDGWTPFTRRRDNISAAWRMAVWVLMRGEGYTFHQIGDATGRDHSTVVAGVRRFGDGLAVGDWLCVKVWRQLNEIID